MATSAAERLKQIQSEKTQTKYQPQQEQKQADITANPIAQMRLQ